MDYFHALPQSTISKFQGVKPFILVSLAAVVYWFVLSRRIWKLRGIPTVGSALPVIGTIDFIKDTYNLVANGMQKWPGRIFKINSTMGWILVVTDPTLVTEIRRAPEHILSKFKVVEQRIQTRFTLDSRVTDNPVHVPLIKNRLIKETPTLIPDIYDEIAESCTRYFAAKDEWSSVTVHKSMTPIIAHVSNRVFVGPILCRNPEWIDLCIEFVGEVVKIAFLLGRFPQFMRQLVYYFMGNKLAQRNRDGMRLLGPIIAARRNEMRDGDRVPNDFLSWLLDEAKGEDDDSIVARIISINFAAIHTTAMAITQVLFDLASNPEYLEPLREEVEEVTKRDGWTKTALDQMHKVDSFMKESQRFHPVGVLMLDRQACVDFTFSDGTVVPAGTIVGVPSSTVHFNPETYEDPFKFDGFRFAKLKERAALAGDSDKKFEFVTANAQFIGFGQGRHTCPGRFFAGAEIKLLLAHIVTTYDVKLPDGASRPQDLILMNAIRPDPAGNICIRRRQ